ncbi:MAG: DUF3458 domain-containing protein, partial [Desulfuromonadales bacterium]|nr:DUF3458 domain-containing protein [Desulfuromonadales bacterium]
QLSGEDVPAKGTRILRVAAAEQTFRFVNVKSRPVPSLLRNFSAPVRIGYAYSADELAFLFAHDSDPFNRWEAGQRLATQVLLTMIADLQADLAPVVPKAFAVAFRTALVDATADPALLALALTLPGEVELAEAMAVADPGAVHAARQQLRRTLAVSLAGEFRSVMAAVDDACAYQLTPSAIGRRSLKNLCLAYLSLVETPEIAAGCMARFTGADNMTDRLAALTCLAHGELPQRETALAEFYRRYQNDPLVVDKWFAVQAASPRADTLAQVKMLMAHPAFTMKNPNRVRSLIGVFAHGNPARFHDPSGAGYRFLADRVIELDPLNPQVAARMVAALSRWRRFDENRQVLMKVELERVRTQPGLSRDVGEIVGKSLLDS